ncbi:ORMDL domain-containing protein [Venturia nashicola]|uniref:ORMDL domain-containing protein n=1 Tax=Venturia nashicola TaxID=86259 RepID=A0A4Z1NVC3_9PEZI|nr:ORMDL domain-containing protein [Venturia nashicola]
MSSDRGSRKRRSSSIVYHEPPESIEQLSDQSALPNLNAEWVNAKGTAHNEHPTGMGRRPRAVKNELVSRIGAWLIHPVLIFCLKIVFDIVPGISQETSWTLTNLTYMAASYLMFHWVRGIPFDFNAGAYDNLNMWEQIDNGDQYTPAKKYLMSVPIVLFLVSTHYTHYDLKMFILNLVATILITLPKLPTAHRLRVTFLSGPPDDRSRD